MHREKQRVLIGQARDPRRRPHRIEKLKKLTDWIKYFYREMEEDKLAEKKKKNTGHTTLKRRGGRHRNQ